MVIIAELRGRVVKVLILNHLTLTHRCGFEDSGESRVVTIGPFRVIFSYDVFLGFIFEVKGHNLCGWYGDYTYTMIISNNYAALSYSCRFNPYTAE